MINEKKFLKDYLYQYFLFLLKNNYQLNYPYVKKIEVTEKSNKTNKTNTISDIKSFETVAHKISSTFGSFNINHFCLNKTSKNTPSQFILEKYFTFNDEEKKYFISNFKKFTQNSEQYAIFLNKIPFEDFKENIYSVKINDFSVSDYDLTKLIKKLKTFQISQKEVFNVVKHYVQRRKTSLNKDNKETIKKILIDNFTQKEITILSKYINYLSIENQIDNTVVFEKSINYMSEININLKNLLKYISSDNYKYENIKNDFLNIIKTIQPIYGYSEYKEFTNLKSITQIILMSDYPILTNEIKDDISTLFHLKIKNPEFSLTPEVINSILSAKKLEKILPINTKSENKAIKI